MRGKVRIRVVFRPRFGITPACAGKSQHQRGKNSCIGDHPRLRGEKANAAATSSGKLGSPPLARGKGRSPLCCFGGWRITPACAGKSRRGSSAVASSKDHPRLRGEKFGRIVILSCRRGSPPLARGKVLCMPSFVVPSGITPACAGKSGKTAAQKQVARDHPRLRGEKLLLFCPSWGCRGITPACAGKRKGSLVFLREVEDHPRLRGEKH